MNTQSLSREEKVRQRAHELWESEGRPEGKHLEHWQQAEQDILAEADTATDPYQEAKKS